MSNFRRLPPVLRVASLLRLLFPLALMAVFFGSRILHQWTSPQSSLYISRGAVIAINLGIVGMACTRAVRTYSMRFRQQGSGPFALDTWQSQVRAILLPAAVSICALVLAVAIPPTVRTFQIVFPISIVGAGVFLAFLLVSIQREAMG